MKFTIDSTTEQVQSTGGIALAAKISEKIKTAALRPDIHEYAIHARNASGRWMCWNWLKNL